MAIFFSSPTKSRHPTYEPVLMNALALDPIADLNSRRIHARRLLEEVEQPPDKPALVLWRVLVAFVLLVIVFVVATLMGKTPEYAKASETLLHCFELLFTATIGLLGIEAAKHG